MTSRTHPDDFISGGTFEIRPDQPREAPRGPSCEGCSHNWYSAPGGQSLNGLIGPFAVAQRTITDSELVAISR